MKRLKELRNSMKLRQRDIAEKIGVDRTTYTKYEVGDSEPSNEMILKLAVVFDVSTDYLLGISDKKKPFVSKMDVSGISALTDFSAETQEAIELLQRLNPDNLDKALEYIRFELERQQHKETKNN
ncbi:MAG: helix-turn-helix transcriptional regulator [Bacteroides sp.]